MSGNTVIGGGTVIYPNVHLEGKTKIGKGCTIYPNVRLVDSVIEDGAIIKDSTLIESSLVKREASVGPFTHIRPASEIGANARIGNFVEVKKSVIGPNTKASHLSYLGDAKIGKDVNIGAGTITCNYDGHQKHITTIEDGVFIGSDAQLIAVDAMEDKVCLRPHGRTSRSQPGAIQPLVRLHLNDLSPHVSQ